MPILNPSDPMVARLGLNIDRFGTTLPDPRGVASTFSSFAVSAAQEDFAQSQMANMATGYQRVTGLVMQRIGAPQGDAVLGSDQFDGAIGLLRIDNIASALIGALGDTELMGLAKGMPEELQEILMDLLEDMLAPLMEQLGSIPVYGWILEAAFDLIVGIVKIVKIFKEQNAPDPEREYELSQFSPEADLIVSGEIMRMVRSSSNWTDVYMPPGIGHTESWYKKDFFVEKLVNDAGYRMTTAGAQEGWAGLVPGTSQIDHGFEIFNNGVSRGLGELFPTSRNLNVSIWDQLNRVGSPTMYTVDAVRCMRYWEGHLQQLLAQLFDSDYDGIRDFVNGAGAAYFGWAPYDEGKAAWRKWGISGEGYDGDQDAYLDDLGVSRRTPYTPARAMHTLWERQMAGLNTTACAYVDRGSFGALSGSTQFQPETEQLIERFETNRQILLGHRARCGIDTSNIPDHTYKAAMETAQSTCIASHLGEIAPSGNTGQRRVRRFRPRFKFLEDPDGVPPVDQAPGGRRRFRPGADGTTGAGAVLGIAGVAGIVAILMRRGR